MKIRKIGIIALLTLLVGGLTAHAQSIFIGATSYPTLQAAIDAAQPGDVIQLSSGNFGAAETNAVVINGKTNITLRGTGMFTTTFRPGAVSRRLNPAPNNPTSTPWAYAGGGYWPKPSNTIDDVPTPASSEPWRPYVYIANSVGLIIENMGFDFASVTGTNRNNNNVAIVGVLAHNITGLVISNVSMRGMSTQNQYNQEVLFGAVNDGAPYSVDNKGTISIYNSDFYNVNRGGIRARWFLNVYVFNTKVQKSPNSDTLANAVHIGELVDFTFENSLISGFTSPFNNIWQSAGFLINNNYKYPGWEAYVNNPPTQTVNIIGSTISEAYFGLYVLGSWTPRVLNLNVSNSLIKDCPGQGVSLISDDARHYEGNRAVYNFANTVISGNGFNRATGYGLIHGTDHPRNTLNMTGVVFTNNSVLDYGGAEAINSNGYINLSVSNTKFDKSSQLRFLNTGTSTYDISRNYYGSENPDFFSTWVDTEPVPLITNIFTDASLTTTRRVLTVCTDCPKADPAAHATISSALAAATGDDLIYVFNTPVLTNTVTVAANRTMWTRNGLIFTNAGSLVINSDVVLTLDGVDLTGPITITTNTVGVIQQRQPALRGDGVSLDVRGTIAWTPCFVDVYALVSPTNTAPVGNTTNGWAVVRKLNKLGMNTGEFSGIVSNLSNNVNYTIQIVGIVSSNLPTTPHGLTHPSMRKFAVALNTCNKTANFFCDWRTSQHYTQLVAYASTTNSTGGFWLEDGDTVWNDDAPKGYPAGSPTTITWGALRALVDAGENMPGLYVNPLPRIPIPLDDPRSTWSVYLNNANQCNGDPIVPPGQASWGQWKLWQVLLSYADLTNAVRTNACFAAGQGNITLYNNHFADWSDFNKLKSEIALYGNEIRLTQSTPVPCAGLPNIYSDRRTVRLIKEVDVVDVISGGVSDAASISNLNVTVEVDAGQSVTVEVFANQLVPPAIASVTLTNSGTPEFENLLTSDGTFFIRTTRTSEGSITTNDFSVVRRTYVPGSLNLVGVVFDFVAGANTMGGALGQQLANGLRTPGFGDSQDTVYVRGTNNVWLTFTWNGTSWAGVAGASTNAAINSTAAFYVQPSGLGDNRVSIYRGRTQTAGSSTTIASGNNNLTWPLPVARGQSGWNFTGGTRNNVARNADQITIGTTTIFLKADGQWYLLSSPSTLYTNTLGPNQTFRYTARRAFTWTIE